MTQQNHSWKKHLGSWGTYAAALYSGVQDVTASLVNQGNVLTSQDATFAVDQVNEKMLVKNFEPTHRFGFAAFSTNGAHHLTVAMTAANFVAKAYALSQPILVAGQKSSFPALRVHNQVSSRGPVGTATEIIGFKSTNTGDLGWMRIKVFDHNGDGFPDEVEAIDWAYNSTSGGAINAGQTSSASAPEPSTLALDLLALGAAGLLAFRKHRKELAASR